jgi:hypothetical protein
MVGPTISIALLCVLRPGPAGGETIGPIRNGFSLSGASIPAKDIVSGGPGRDGIPALTAAKVVSQHAARWRDDELVIGIEINGMTRAYPVAILNWHELVNDTVSGVAVLVSYCPLCGTGIVFRRNVEGRIRTFGVSGLLYHSDMLLYDRETESLWSQIASIAVTGSSIGTRLELIRSRQMSWGRWRHENPKTTVLSSDTGFRRNYSRSPYRGYAESNRLLFPVPKFAQLDTRYPRKMPTLGIRTREGVARAYPAAEITAAGGRVTERLDGVEITITYSPDLAEFHASVPAQFEVIQGYWFAWLAFHPDSTVFVAPPLKDAAVSF